MMGTSNKSKARRGFTLIELMVAMAIGLILIAGVYQVFIAQQKSYTAQDETANMQKSASMAETMLVKTILQAGAVAPEGGESGNLVGQAVMAASDHYIALQYDDPAYPEHRGSVTANEVVLFALSKPGGTPTETVEFTANFDNNGNGTIDLPGESYVIRVPLVLNGPPYNLYRITPNATNPLGPPDMELVADNVDNLVFKYRDNDGSPIPPTSDTDKTVRPMPYYMDDNKDPNAAMYRANIRSIEILMTLRGTKADPAFTEVYTPPDNSVATYDGAGVERSGISFDDHLRRRTYTISAAPRNLPANACGKIVLKADPDSPKCPESSTITATVFNRLGQFVTTGDITFSLGSSSTLVPAPTLTGGGQTATVGLDANGQARVMVSYTGTATGIMVSAQTSVDCQPEGPPNFTLSDAITINFKKADEAQVIVFDTDATYSPIADNHWLETCNPTTAKFVARTYDQCGNDTPPAVGAIELVSSDAGGGDMGTVTPSKVSSSSEEFTINKGAPTAIALAARKMGAGTEGSWDQIIRVKDIPAGVELFHGSDFEGRDPILPAGTTTIYNIGVYPWPPVATDPADILQGVVPPLATTDCATSNDPKTFKFKVLDCNQTPIWNLAFNEDDAKNVTADFAAAIGPLSQYGTLTTMDWGMAKDSVPLPMTRVRALTDEFEFTYASKICDPLNRNLLSPSETQRDFTLVASSNFGSGPWSLAGKVDPCKNCNVAFNSTQISTCDTDSSISLSDGCGDFYFLLKLESNPPVAVDPPRWITPSEEGHSLPDEIIVQAVAGGVKNVLFTIGSAPVNTSITVKSYKIDKSLKDVALIPLGANPTCETLPPMVVKNACSDYRAWTNQGTLNASECAASINKLFFEIKHCKTIPAGNTTLSLSPDTAASYDADMLVELLDEAGNVFDSVKVKLTTDPTGIVTVKNSAGVDTTMERHTIFNNNTNELDHIYLQPTAAVATNKNDNILSYPIGQNATIVVNPWDDPLDDGPTCPPNKKLYTLTAPLPLCFPNAISSGGGGTWHGNFLVHWGDVVIRGSMDDASTPKRVEKLSTAPLLAGTKEQTDRFADVYVGFALDGAPNDGNIIGQPAPLAGVNRPYLADGFGNYFTTISNTKINKMISVLDYDTLRNLARGKSDYSYWVTIPGTEKLYCPKKGVTLDNIETLLKNPNTAGNPYYDGKFVFVDTFGIQTSPGVYEGPYNPPLTPPPTLSTPSKQIDDDAATGKLPTHSITGGGFYTSGIIYIAGNFNLGGTGGTTNITAFSPPEFEERYDHNRAAQYTEDELPISPISNESTSKSETIGVHLNGAIYVDGVMDFSGNPSVYGALTAERGFGSGGNPEIWYNYTLNSSGLVNSLCVSCCSIGVNPGIATLGFGESTQLTATHAHGSDIRWYSGDPSIADVDNTGKVTAKNVPGQVEIWVADTNNCTTKATITVATLCSKSTVTPFNMNLVMGSLPTGTFTMSPNEVTATWLWSSDNTNVATVAGSDSFATVTAKGCGVATVKAHDGGSVCTEEPFGMVSVTSGLAITTFAPSKPTYTLNETAIISTTGSSGGALTWTSVPAGAVTFTSVGDNTKIQAKFVQSGNGVQIFVNDPTYANCNAVGSSLFNVGCTNPTVATTVNGSSAASVTLTKVGGVNNMVWAAVPNDQDGTGTTLDNVEKVEFTITPPAGVSLASTNWPVGGIVNDSATEYCGNSLGTVNNCAGTPQDIKNWPDGAYTLQTKVYSKDYGCGVLTGTASNVTLNVNNCDLDYSDIFSTSPLASPPWLSATCVGNTAIAGPIPATDCNGAASASTAVTAGRLRLTTTTRNVATPNPSVSFESLNPASVAPSTLITNTKPFSMQVDVTALGASAGVADINAKSRAGLMVRENNLNDTNTGRYIFVVTNTTGYKIMYNSTGVAGADVIATGAATGTPKMVWTAATNTMNIYVGGALVRSQVIPFANGNLYAGPYLYVDSGSTKNKSYWAEFDNFSINCQ